MQLGGSKAIGQQPDPAWFHPFPARMPLSVAKHLVEQLTGREAVILDPMIGSGTTLIAARLLGRQGIGFDREPLSLLIARSAIASFESQRLEQLRMRILDRGQRALHSRKIRLTYFSNRIPREDQQFIKYWFPPESQRQLFALADAIGREPNRAEKDFAWVVFSSLIIAKLAGASLALDLPRSRPHKRSEKNVVLPLDAWTRRFRIAVARLPLKDRDMDGSAQILRGDARELPLKDRTVDFVLTSPPYLNAVDYVRVHKFSLVWMGYSMAELRKLRGSMVGTERGLWAFDGIPPRLENRLEEVVEEDRKRAQRRRYLSDLAKILGEVARVLRPGGLAVLALGPTMISSRQGDAVDVMAALGGSVGLRVVGSVTRCLRAAHRSLPPPRSVEAGNPLARRMRREVLVALRR